MRTLLPERGRSAVLVLLWCLPYFVYAAGTGDVRAAAILRLLAVAVPLVSIYTFFPVRNNSRFTWQDLVIALWLIAVLLSHELKGVWNVPANLDFMTRLFLIVTAAHCWIFVRPVPKLGYTFSFSMRTFRAAVVNFGFFAIIAMPLSLAMRFTAWNPRWHGVAAFGADYLEIFLFIALLEEIFFRGFLQSLLSNSLQSGRKGQALVACIFGLFHILHAPFPNWRYVALATFAGWFYGSAFVEAGNLLAPAITHALVDTVWRTFFERGS